MTKAEETKTAALEHGVNTAAFPSRTSVIIYKVQEADSVIESHNLSINTQEKKFDDVPMTAHLTFKEN